MKIPGKISRIPTVLGAIPPKIAKLKIMDLVLVAGSNHQSWPLLGAEKSGSRGRSTGVGSGAGFRTNGSSGRGSVESVEAGSIRTSKDMLSGNAQVSHSLSHPPKPNGTPVRFGIVHPPFSNLTAPRATPESLHEMTVRIRSHRHLS